MRVQSISEIVSKWVRSGARDAGNRTRRIVAHRGSVKLMKAFLSCLFLLCADPSSEVVMPNVRPYTCCRPGTKPLYPGTFGSILAGAVRARGLRSAATPRSRGISLNDMDVASPAKLFTVAAWACRLFVVALPKVFSVPASRPGI